MSRRPGLIARILNLFRPAPPRRLAATPRAALSRSGPLATHEVPLPGRGALAMHYAPARNGMPDGGEVVWAWVPFQEDPAQGKDRPLLVIGKQDADRVYALKLTSKSHDAEHDYLPIGAGAWDSRGRPSWVDIDQLYSLHKHGIRREASAVDAETFAQVAQVLARRYGWQQV